jgi:hypothetical protein
LLNVKNIKITRSFKKLNHKYIESFEILLLIDKQTYRLRLSKSYDSIHNVFHVSLLKSFKAWFDESSTFLSILVENEKHYEIESILDNRIWHKKLQYFVKWLRWSNAKNQWISSQEIRANELIKKFHRKYSRKSKESKTIWFVKRLRFD